MASDSSPFESDVPPLRRLVVQRTRQMGITLSDVAERAGITRAYLHRLTHGNTLNPGIRTLQSIARALQIPPSAVYRAFTDAVSLERSPTIRYEGLPPGQGGAGADDAMMFVSDVTIPDHSVVLPGERFTKTWAIQNVGEIAWKNRQLCRADDELVVSMRNPMGELQPLLESHLASLGRSIPIPDTEPGQMVELSVEFAAPTENCSVASIWRITDELGQPCFSPRCFLQVIVTVVGG